MKKTLKVVFEPIAEHIAITLADELAVKKAHLTSRDEYIKNQSKHFTSELEKHFLQVEEICNKAGSLLKEQMTFLSLVKKTQFQKEIGSAIQLIMQITLDPKAIPLNKEIASSNTFQAFLGISQEILDWIYECGYLFYTNKQHEESHAIFFLLTQLNSLIPDYWVALGLSQRRLQKESEALDSFSIASLLQPDHLIARYNSAEIYHHLGQINDAKAELEVLEKIVKKEQLDDLKKTIHGLKAKIAIAESG